MTDLIHNQPRALAPRKLEQRETLQSLNHWKCVFKNYYRRCQFYGYFLAPDVKWNSERNRGFTQSEANGLKRDPPTLASDLEGFLGCLGSYLPFDYVGEKLNTESTDMISVWDIIYEIYDAEVDTTNYLDYATMVKQPEETYRNFFNRLVGFVRQHLPRKKIEAEGISSPSSGETLSIGLLDSIAIHWLLSIDKRLVGIIKTEFAAELKQKRLCQMIKTIASNIDELLVRYDNQKDQVGVVYSNSSQSHVTASQTGYSEDPQAVDMIIRRIERLESDRFRPQQRFRGRANRSSFGNSRPQERCQHCSFINRQLGSSLNTNHKSATCGKK